MSVKVITADMAGLFLVTTVNMSELAFRNSTLDDSGNGIEMPAMTKYSFAIENTINTVKLFLHI